MTGPPPHFEQGLLNALRKASIQPESIEALRHGTTVVINALLERKGAKTALITKEGFRDLLEIGRGNRVQACNVLHHRLRPFVPRSLRFEVRERIGTNGDGVAPLDTAGLDLIIEQISLRPGRKPAAPPSLSPKKSPRWRACSRRPWA